MTAIVFNGRDAIKWGTANISRVYAGTALVWSKNVGLPYTNALAALPAEWTTTHGTWTPTAFNGNNGLSGNSIGGAQSMHKTISAYNVHVSVTFSVASKGGASVTLLARDTALGGYYSCKYENLSATGHLTILANGAQLGAWNIPGAPKQGVMELSCVGTTITAKIGAVSHSVTDASIHEPGTVGIEAQGGGWLRNVSVTAA